MIALYWGVAAPLTWEDNLGKTRYLLLSMTSCMVLMGISAILKLATERLTFSLKRRRVSISEGTLNLFRMFSVFGEFRWTNLKPKRHMVITNNTQFFLYWNCLWPLMQDSICLNIVFPQQTTALLQYVKQIIKIKHVTTSKNFIYNYSFLIGPFQNKHFVS